jgi:RNA polymerase sigma factor (sigma-70 family)
VVSAIEALVASGYHVGIPKMPENPGLAHPSPSAAPIPLQSAESSTQLLLRAKDGDEGALNLLYQRCLVPLRQWARGRLPRWARDLTDTDDLVQETLLRSLRGVDAFDPRHSGAFLAYLRQGILNRMKDEIRRARRLPESGGTAGAIPDDRPSPIEEAIGHECLTRYEDALLRLKPEDREAILARVEMGLSFQQMAETLGRPSADAARVATSRALLRLAREMADE